MYERVTKSKHSGKIFIQFQSVTLEKSANEVTFVTGRKHDVNRGFHLPHIDEQYFAFFCSVCCFDDDGDKNMSFQ